MQDPLCNPVISGTREETKRRAYETKTMGTETSHGFFP